MLKGMQGCQHIYVGCALTYTYIHTYIQVCRGCKCMWAAYCRPLRNFQGKSLQTGMFVCMYACIIWIRMCVCMYVCIHTHEDHLV